MTTTMLTTEKVRAGLQEAEQRAAAAWAAADKVRADIIAAGEDPTEGEAFTRIDEAFKAYDGARDEAAQLQSKLSELSRIDAMYQGGGSGGGRLEQPDRGRMGEHHSGRIGARFTENPQYRALFESGLLVPGQEPSVGAVQGVANAIARPVSLFKRDEIEALLRAQKIGATTVTGGGATSAGPFIQNDLQSGFVPYIRKTPSLASIVGGGVTDSDVVEYVTQSAPDSNAAATAEDTQANASTYTWATNTANVREITHYIPVTLRAMADEGQIRTIVENELLLDLFDELDDLIASGGGSGQDFTGIYNAGIQTQEKGADNYSAAIHKAMTKVRTAAGVLMECDYIGMHPNDWEKVRLEEDGQGRYIFGPPSMAGEKQIWGVPVIPSTVFTEGTPLVGNYGRAARLWLREGASVTSGLDGNDFTTRRITLLAAMRAAFAVIYASGFCQTTGFGS